MKRRIHKLLIANRGEIAIRVIRTCRDMGIATVAVYSDADARAAHVDAADQAVRIGPAPARESYLAAERILDAAALTGADAIHPGYGFLAENAAFARVCAERGLLFVGPAAEVIERLGDKREARRIAAAAGVPVVPGYDGSDQDLATFEAEAGRIGYPVLVKASAGGGGKGMRVVRAAGELAPAIDAARREAKSAFGDDTLLLEAYIERPRHVEIQILGDEHGNLVHLFERECSIQRRHQKIIEEAPSPAVDNELRAAMGAAAVTVGRAVGYVSAGTVEMLLGPDRRFYFLEVNTRLQVEHPVTEYVTGLDLVREQLRVARGEAIELDEGRVSGAAIECRLCAEDPESGHLPATGTLVDWHVPEALVRTPGVRVDAGVRAGQDIGIHYDPLLAKIICHAPTRAEAIDKMMYSLGAMSIHGVVTNRALLLAVLAHPAFQAGELDTHFLDTHAAELAAPTPPAAALAIAALAAALAAHERRRAARTLLPDLEPGFRNNRYCDQRVEYDAGGRHVIVSYRNQGQGSFHVAVTVDGEDTLSGEVQGVRMDGYAIVFEDPRGCRHRVRVIASGDEHFAHGVELDIALVERPRFPRADEAAVSGGLSAPMPGRILQVLVAEEQAVSAGHALVIIEAMKMEHTVKAPHDGVVSRVLVAAGDQVDAGALLAVIAARD